MSKMRWIRALAAGAALLAAAAAQLVPGAPRIEVNLLGAQLKRNAKIAYPPAALDRGVQGTVVAQVTLDESGAVTGARILSGPNELRQTVIDWARSLQFSYGVPAGTRQVRVIFALPTPGERMSCCGPVPPGEASLPAGPRTSPGGQAPMPLPVYKRVAVSGEAQALKLISTVKPIPQPESVPISGTVRLRAIIGQDGIVQSLSPLSGPPMLISAAGDAAMQYVYQPTVIDGEPVEVSTSIDVQFRPVSPETGAAPPRIRVGSILTDNLVVHVKPVYPPEAIKARIQGDVVLTATIGKDGGAPRGITVVSGHPLLVPAALDAVKQWVYKPTMLNGEPVELRITITVPFTLQ